MIDGWLAVAAGLVLGSVPTGWIASRLAGAPDPRSHGSGSTGATNVLRVAGVGAALATLGIDAAKGALAVTASAVWGGSPELAWRCAAVLAAASAHVWSPWLRGRGGKGVATVAGGFVVLAPLAVAAAAAAFVAAVAISRRVSVGSLVGAWTLPLASAGLGAPAAVWVAGILGAAAISWWHRANVRRIVDGTEPRLGRPGSHGSR